MKSIFWALSIVIAAAALITACSTKSAKTASTAPAVPKYQEVEFTEAEVPYIQAVKKDGKLSAVIVTPSNSKSTN